ncbi:MAG: hypothetical protein IJR82_00445 [Bacilli bacterium]|nr:hypothetical protein [Bacilli bacterium]
MERNYFEYLKQLKLKRDEKGFYSLNDESANHLFGINDYMTLTPDQYHIALFAAANYLFGIFGVNVSSFTSVSAGYLASYTRDNAFYGTFFTNEFFLTNELLKLCDEKIKTNEDIDFYMGIKDILSKQITLLEKSLMISSYLKENNRSNITDNINKSVSQYDQVNQQNCRDNHFIICKVIANGNDSLARDLNGIKDLKEEEAMKRIEELVSSLTFSTPFDKNTYAQALQQGYAKYQVILGDFILPGYLTYRGTDRDGNAIEQKSQILNEPSRITELKKILGYDNLDYAGRKDAFINVISILNMCSTDYSADMVYNVMKGIDAYQYQGENINDTINLLINTTIPLTPNNWEQRNETRKIRS